jgi:hypothetical protein
MTAIPCSSTYVMPQQPNHDKPTSFPINKYRFLSQDGQRLTNIAFSYQFTYLRAAYEVVFNFPLYVSPGAGKQRCHV